jgi:hypothetical protein
MTIYLNTKTQEYPRYDGDLENLGWSLGQPLPENWVEVAYTDPPTVDTNTTYEIQFPQLINGIWTITWITRPLTANEIVRRDTPMPKDGKEYVWNEPNLKWQVINLF